MSQEYRSRAQIRANIRKERGQTINKLHFKEVESSTTLEEYFDISLNEVDIKQACSEYSNRIIEVQKRFLEKTKLSKSDLGFLMLAVGMQCIRQYMISPFKERVDHEATKKADKITENKIYDKMEKYSVDGGTSGGYYYRSFEDIILKGVPYDVIKGGSPIELSGMNHRYKTLGHDPILGWFFGTVNIMTNTLTTNDFSSYHIRNTENGNGVISPGIYSRAKNDRILKAAIERTQNEPVALATAILKQGIHLKSDINTVKGLPIPFVQSISPDLAKGLAEYGIDTANVAKTVEQAALATFINTIIAMIHKLCYDENIHGDERLYKVRTRKIILYSNVIASTSNVIYVAFSKDIKKLDIGGLLVTFYRIMKDEKFITKVMDEYVNSELNSIYDNELNKVNEEFNRLLEEFK